MNNFDGGQRLCTHHISQPQPGRCNCSATRSIPYLPITGGQMRLCQTQRAGSMPVASYGGTTDTPAKSGTAQQPLLDCHNHLHQCHPVTCPLNIKNVPLSSSLANPDTPIIISSIKSAHPPSFVLAHHAVVMGISLCLGAWGAGSLGMARLSTPFFTLALISSPLTSLGSSTLRLNAL